MEENKKQNTPQTYSLDVGKNNGQSQNGTSVLSSIMQKTPDAGAPSGNVFTKLFGKKSAVPATPGSPAAALANKPVLGPRPVLVASPAIQQEIENRKNRTAAKVLVAVMLVVLGGVIFFKAILTPGFELFGKNVAARFVASLEDLRKEKTKENEMKFRIAKLHLDQIGRFGDAFRQSYARLSNSASTKADRTNAQTELNRLKAEMKKSFSALKGIFAEGITVPIAGIIEEESKNAKQDFEKRLQALLESRKSEFANVETPEAIFERRALDGMIGIVQRTDLQNEIANMNADELSDEQVIALLEKMQISGSDDLSILTSIKQKRVQWTSVISDIENVTRQVDKLYGQGLFEDIGGIQYTSYDFDKSNGQVAVAGSIKTEDSKTFSLIANLIDSFEKSPKFKDVEMRMFSKAPEEDLSFISSIRLTFLMQEGDDPRDELLPSL